MTADNVPAGLRRPRLLRKSGVVARLVKPETRVLVTVQLPDEARLPGGFPGRTLPHVPSYRRRQVGECSPANNPPRNRDYRRERSSTRG
jgi:hypothetical protein